MKKVACLLFALPSLPGCAQKSMTFRQARRAGIFEALDKRYPGGIYEDTAKSLFKDRAAYAKAYQAFLANFDDFLRAKGFVWGRQVRCFNKLYSSKAGTVDYFFYNLRPGDLPLARERKVADLLAKYIQTARFGLTATAQFAQCSMVQYTDNERSS